MSRIRSICLLMLLSSVAFAEPDDPEATFKKGYSAWSSGDIVGSMPLLKSAADAGHAGAQALYGSLLDEADNDAEAAEYYRKAAEQNNGDGAFGLAGLYLTGDAGTRDPAKALALYEKAANLGNEQAAIVLAVGYQNDDFGLGQSAKDSPQAWKWIMKAAELAHLDSMIRMEDAYRKGSPHVPQNIAAADALQTKILKQQGLDKLKKRRRR